MAGKNKLKEKKTVEVITSMTTETVEQKMPIVGKRTRTVKTVPKPVVEVVEEVKPMDAPEVVEETDVSESDASVEDRINSLREVLNNNVKDLKESLKVFLTLDQELKKLAVVVKKEFKKKVKKSGIKKQSNHGFNAPVLVSDELADFLSLPHGSIIRPPQVASMISKYAIEHDLKEKTNKAVYNCDAKMKKLLGEYIYHIKKSEPALGMGVSIFNLNSYLKPHFTKVETPVA